MNMVIWKNPDVWAKQWMNSNEIIVAACAFDICCGFLVFLLTHSFTGSLPFLSLSVGNVLAMDFGVEYFFLLRCNIFRKRIIGSDRLEATKMCSWNIGELFYGVLPNISTIPIVAMLFHPYRPMLNASCYNLKEHERWVNLLMLFDDWKLSDCSHVN